MTSSLPLDHLVDDWPTSSHITDSPLILPYSFRNTHAYNITPFSPDFYYFHGVIAHAFPLSIFPYLPLCLHITLLAEGARLTNDCKLSVQHGGIFQELVA